METRVYLVRHGVTDWHSQNKVLGQRDIPLSELGTRQAESVAEALRGSVERVGDVITSPLVRAVQTAEHIGRAFGIEVARDPRLIDFRVGRWEGMTYAEVSASPDYQRFLADPMSERIPGGESMAEIRRRAINAIEQTLEDTPAGEGVVVVTHAGVIRVLLTHYAGSAPGNYHRIRVAPGSVSVLSFTDDRELPRILITNWRPALADALG